MVALSFSFAHKHELPVDNKFRGLSELSCNCDVSPYTGGTTHLSFAIFNVFFFRVLISGERSAAFEVLPLLLLAVKHSSMVAE